MSTITREQAQKIIEAADEVITALAGTNEDVHPESDNMLRLWDDLNDRYAPPEVVRDLARIALASLEAEPVPFDDLRDAVAEVSGGAAMEWSDIYKGHQAVPFINFNSLARIVDKFRTATPAPFTLPVQHWEELCRQNPDMSIGDAIIRAAWWNHCAAMLQTGNSPAPFCSCPAQNSVTPAQDGNSPVIPDGWVLVPAEPTSEMYDAGDRQLATKQVWDAMVAAAPQREVK